MHLEVYMNFLIIIYIYIFLIIIFKNQSIKIIPSNILTNQIIIFKINQLNLYLRDFFKFLIFNILFFEFIFS